MLTHHLASIAILCIYSLERSLEPTPHCHSLTTIIDIHYHFVRECLINKKFSIKYTQTTSNPADIFTKALNAPKFI